MKTVYERAYAFAYNAHGNQKYGNNESYMYHVSQVADVLEEFGFDTSKQEHASLFVAAYLHDTIEDTATSYNDIKIEFGEEVAEIVYCVTDERGRNRKEKHAKTYSKIRSNAKAVIVKVADRVANVRYSIQHNSSQINMYKKEFEEFQRELRVYKQVDNMWDELSNLCWE